MSLSKVRLELPIHSKLSEVEKLLKVYSLAKSLKELGGSVYVRKNFILRAESKTRGILPLYREMCVDHRVIHFLRSYIISDFMDLLLPLLKAVSDVRITTNNEVELIVMKYKKSITLEREPKNYLAKIILMFPRWFRKGSVTLITSGDLMTHVLKIVKKGLSKRSSVNSYTDQVPWNEVSEKKARFLVKSLRNYSLEELYSIISSLKPTRSELELRAGLDIFEYGQDVAERFLITLNQLKSRAKGQRLVRAIENVEALVMNNRNKLGFATPDEKFVRELLDNIRYLSEWARVDKEELRKMLPIPSKKIIIRLWERSLDDLFIGFYAKTCIALDERKVMHEYIFDPYTLFFRIYVNEKPVGHAKVFVCKDEDGEKVLHIDYIGLSKGKYRQLHDCLKLHSLSAVIRYAMLKGYRRVYVAREIIPTLNAKSIRNKLTKLGKQVYSQYLCEDKFLVWEST